MIYPCCVACGNTGNLAQHHLIPRSLGGSDAPDNMLTLCGSCHAKVHEVRANWNHAELTRQAMRRKQAKGEKIGAVPYSYTLAADGVNLLPDPVEQDVIAQARELHASGMSLRKVAAELQRRGFSARNGQPFQATQIQRMVA